MKRVSLPFFFTQLAFPGHVISNTSGFVGGAAGEQQKMPTFLNAYFFPRKFSFLHIGNVLPCRILYFYFPTRHIVGAAAASWKKFAILKVKTIAWHRKSGEEE